PLFIRRHRNMAGNPKLGWNHIQRTDHRVFIAIGSCMDVAAQAAPDNHITAGDNLCAWVHIAENDHMPQTMYPPARPDSAADHDAVAAIFFLMVDDKSDAFSLRVNAIARVIGRDVTGTKIERNRRFDGCVAFARYRLKRNATTFQQRLE